MTAHASAEILSAYLDDELAEGERRETERHLAACPDCRARLDSLGRVVGTLKRLERAAPPAALPQLVQRRIALTGARPSYLERLEERLQGLGLTSPLAASFALVLALAAMLYLFAHGLERRERRGVPIVVPTPEAAREFAEATAHLDPATVRAGGRTFTRSAARWLERGLEREEVAGILAPGPAVAADSPAGRELLARFPWLAELVAGADAVLFRDGEAVVEIRGPTAAPPPSESR
jgi:hypothetical protein